jgi:hypothetical protein
VIAIVISAARSARGRSLDLIREDLLGSSTGCLRG